MFNFIYLQNLHKNFSMKTLLKIMVLNRHMPSAFTNIAELMSLNQVNSKEKERLTLVTYSVHFSLFNNYYLQLVGKAIAKKD